MLGADTAGQGWGLGAGAPGQPLSLGRQQGALGWGGSRPGEQVVLCLEPE